MTTLIAVLNAAFGVLAAALLVLAGVLALHARTLVLVLLFTQSMGRFILAVAIGALFFALYIRSLLVCKRARDERRTTRATLLWALLPGVPAVVLTAQLIHYGVVLFAAAD